MRNLKRLSNIAVPLDTTPGPTIELAERIARHAGAKIHLFSASYLPIWATSLGGEFVYPPISLRQDLEAADILERTAVANETASHIAGPTEVTVKVGEQESTFLEFLDDAHIDLVVMSSTGAGFWTRVLHTSLAGFVSRASCAPVLIVGPDVDPATVAVDGFQRIVVAANGRRIVSAASDLAGLLAAPNARASFVLVADAGDPSDIRAAGAKARELEDVIREVGPSNCTNRVIVEHGTVAEAIAAKAENLSADLVIVGSRQHSELGDRLFGTTADQVFERATCCVLAVPEGVRDRLRRDEEVDAAGDASFPASDPPSYSART